MSTLIIIVISFLFGYVLGDRHATKFWAKAYDEIIKRI